VLYHARHGPDRLRLGDALLDENRKDKVTWFQRRFRDEPSDRRRPAQAAGADLRELAHEG
jgi:hypothetical protein